MAPLPTETAPNFEIKDLPAIWDLTIEQNWLIRDLIPTESVIMLSGESGSGKSSVALALAACVAEGKPFLGYPTEQRKVLIVDKENGLPVYHERLQRFGIAENKNMFFWGHWCTPEPHGPDSAAIMRFVVEHKPLVIFDSFVAFHPGSEQDATETRQYMEYFRKLAGLGGTIIIIHHTGKGENTKEYRGSSDIKASLDVGYTLTAKKPLLKHLSLKPFKSREGVLDPLMLALEDKDFVLLATEFIPPDNADWQAIVAVIRDHPKCNQGQIVQFLPEMPIYRIRKILLVGEQTGAFKVEKGLKNASFYSLGEVKNAQ